MAVRYQLDPRSSRFTVQAFASGMLRAFAHDPIIVIRDFSGKLTMGEGTSSLRNKIRELVAGGSRQIVLDLADVSYMDSSGLGSLVGLKVSALREGYCTLELVNLTPRVKELLRLSNLTQLFSS